MWPSLSIRRAPSIGRLSDDHLAMVNVAGKFRQPLTFLGDCLPTLPGHVYGRMSFILASPPKNASRYPPFIVDFLRLFKTFSLHFFPLSTWWRGRHHSCRQWCKNLLLESYLFKLHLFGLVCVPAKKPTQIDNIATCLRLLTALGIPLDDVTAADIHQGNLKSILTVFFALSRYKQQQKLKQQQEMAK